MHVLQVVHDAVMSSTTTLTIQDSATSQIENAKLEQVLSDCNILVSRRPRAHFAAKDVEASVEVLLKGKSMVQHEHIVERTVACSALAALVKFTELGAKADNHGAAPHADHAAWSVLAFLTTLWVHNRLRPALPPLIAGVRLLQDGLPWSCTIQRTLCAWTVRLKGRSMCSRRGPQAEAPPASTAC